MKPPSPARPKTRKERGLADEQCIPRWLDGDIDLMEGISDAIPEHDHARADIKERDRKIAREIDSRRETAILIARERKGMDIAYCVIAVVCCVLVILVFMYIIAQLPLYGAENVRATTVAQRYIEHGLEETGAINIVSGMILDYRAFDTLGESHVLFTARIRGRDSKITMPQCARLISRVRMTRS